MNKKPHFIIQFVCISAVLAAILLQSFTHIVKMNPLKGFDKEEHPPVELSFKTYYDGSYQDYLTEHAKRNTGFREFFIRLYNQFSYSCFRQINNDNIKEGRNHELYLKMYLDEITGKTLYSKYGNVEEAKAIAQQNVEETLRLIDTLHSHGTKFLFVFAPSKTWVYPENMPKAYRKQISDFSLEEYYIQLFKENGIPHIDFLNYFRSLKSDSTYPLYTLTGTHWAEATIPMIADSLYRKMEYLWDYKLPKINYKDPNLSTNYSIQDGELEASMNLLFPLRKPAVPNPIFELDDTKDRNHPNLLVVGDSYFVQLRFSCFVDAFNHWDYWKYNRDISSSRPEFQGKEVKWLTEASQVLEEADIVLAIFTAPTLYNYMYGFANSAIKLYEKKVLSASEMIDLTIERIKNNTQWMQAIERQAQEQGITVEENLVRNAKYVIEQDEKKKQQQ